MPVGTNRPRIFYGWWMLLISAVGLFLGAPLTVFSFGVFFPLLVHEFHSSRAAVSFAFTLHNGLGAVCLPFVGGMIDRFGSRRVIVFVMTAFGLTLLSAILVRQSIWQFYLFYAVLGCVLPGPMGFGVVIANWFNRRRGLALGLMGVSIGLGSFLVPLLSRHLITLFGWRATYLIYGSAILLFAMPIVAVFLRNRPSELNLLPDGEAVVHDQALVATHDVEGLTWPEIRRTPTFWIMIGVFVLTSASVHAGILHMPALLSDRGLTPARAALITSMAGIAIMVGRVICGYLLDHLFAPRVGMVFYGAAAAGLALFWAGITGPLALVAAFLVGLGMGAEVEMMAYLSSRYFGLRSFATVYGYAFSAFMIAGAVGPLLMGAGFDHFHSYSVPLGLFCIATFCGVGLLALLGPYRYGVEDPLLPLQPMSVTTGA